MSPQNPNKSLIFHYNLNQSWTLILWGEVERLMDKFVTDFLKEEDKDNENEHLPITPAEEEAFPIPYRQNQRPMYKCKHKRLTIEYQWWDDESQDPICGTHTDYLYSNASPVCICCWPHSIVTANLCVTLHVSSMMCTTKKVCRTFCTVWVLVADFYIDHTCRLKINLFKNVEIWIINQLSF